MTSRSARRGGKEADGVGRRAASPRRAKAGPCTGKEADGVGRRAASRRRAKAGPCAGFTLLEVLAGVLVLGLLYTVLAGAAMRGLRSEGTDRRRAVASLVADRELATIETLLVTGTPLENGLVEKEADPYTILVEVGPADVLALLPAALREEIARTTDPDVPTLLVDEHGQSRVQRLSVVVQWDEAGEPDRVERTTYVFDTSQLAALFPSEGDANGAPSQQDGPLSELRKDAPPELQLLIDQAEQESQ